MFFPETWSIRIRRRTRNVPSQPKPTWHCFRYTLEIESVSSADPIIDDMLPFSGEQLVHKCSTKDSSADARSCQRLESAQSRYAHSTRKLNSRTKTNHFAVFRFAVCAPTLAVASSSPHTHKLAQICPVQIRQQHRRINANRHFRKRFGTNR